MSTPLENLSGTGKPLHPEAPDAKETQGLLRTGLARLTDAANIELGEYEGLLDVDERLVADLITATRAVAVALQAKLP
jgi:hypothetical protein